MKAIVNTEYGSPDRLELQEVDMPVVDADGVLVRVRAASVNPLDWHYLRGKPYLIRVTEGLRRPKTTRRGVDLAGVVEEVGANVTAFRPGDEVFGGRNGAFAEYVCGTEKSFVRKPAALSFEQAAAIPIAGVTALQAIRDKGRLQAGQNVLITGAGGGVGTFAVQIAKALGANVTGVCSTANLDVVRSAGADDVIDYSVADFTRSGKQYDLVLDAAGGRPLSALRRILAPRGTLVIIGAPAGQWLGPVLYPLRAKVWSLFVPQRMLAFLARLNTADLTTLAEMADAGTLVPIVDRTYPLGEAAAAIRYLETGHARGKTVLVV